MPPKGAGEGADVGRGPGGAEQGLGFKRVQQVPFADQIVQKLLAPLVQQGEETLFLAVCVVQGGFVFRLQQEQGLFQVVLGVGKEDFHYFGHKYQLQISVNFLRVLLYT